MTGNRIAIHGPQDVRVEPFDVPEQLEPDQILVSVQYSLISPGTELGGYNAPSRRAPSYPGYTAVGDVAMVAGDSDTHLLGRRVFLFPEKGDSSGCHASHKLFRRAGLAMPLPEGLGAREACFARMVNVALTPYCNVGPKTQGTVFVIGLGLVGNIVGQVGRTRGFATIGADVDVTRRRRARDAGFDAVIDPTETDAAEEVRRLTDGHGADLSVNATGHAEPFMLSLEATADGGEVSTLGGARHAATGDLRDVIREIHTRHLVVRGGWEMQLPLRAVPASKAPSTEANLRNAFRWLRDGAIALESIWTHTIQPDEFQNAYDAVNERDPDFLGVVVDWTAVHE